MLLNFEMKLVVLFVCLDFCIGQLDGVSWNMGENCQGYWICMNGYFMFLCCGNQIRYVLGIGCMVDMMCIEVCLFKILVLLCMFWYLVLI